MDVAPPVAPESGRRLKAAEKAKVKFSDDAGVTDYYSLKGAAKVAHESFVTAMSSYSVHELKAYTLEGEAHIGNTVPMMINAQLNLEQPKPFGYGLYGGGSMGGGCALVSGMNYKCQAEGCINMAFHVLYQDLGKLELCMALGFGTCSSSKMTVGFFGVAVAVTVGNDNYGVTFKVDLSLSMVSKENGGCQHSLSFIVITSILSSYTEYTIYTMSFGSRRRLVADHFDKAARLLQPMGLSDDVLAGAKRDLAAEVASTYS